MTSNHREWSPWGIGFQGWAVPHVVHSPCALEDAVPLSSAAEHLSSTPAASVTSQTGCANLAGGLWSACKCSWPACNHFPDLFNCQIKILTKNVPCCFASMPMNNWLDPYGSQWACCQRYMSIIVVSWKTSQKCRNIAIHEFYKAAVEPFTLVIHE